MRISVAGSRDGLRLVPFQRGFTLLELLVVLAIVALATAGVGLAMRDGTQTQLEREALRLSALLESARAQSQLSGVPVRWQVTPDGFRFTGLQSDPPNELALARTWLNEDTRAHVDVAFTVRAPNTNTAPSLLLGPEPIIEAQSLQLYSASQPEQGGLRLATDGVQPFAVQPAP